MPREIWTQAQVDVLVDSMRAHDGSILDGIRLFMVRCIEHEWEISRQQAYTKAYNLGFRSDGGRRGRPKGSRAPRTDRTAKEIAPAAGPEMLANVLRGFTRAMQECMTDMQKLAARAERVLAVVEARNGGARTGS